MPSLGPRWLCSGPSHSLLRSLRPRNKWPIRYYSTFWVVLYLFNFCWVVLYLFIFCLIIWCFTRPKWRHRGVYLGILAELATKKKNVVFHTKMIIIETSMLCANPYRSPTKALPQTECPPRQPCSPDLWAPRSAHSSPASPDYPHHRWARLARHIEYDHWWNLPNNEHEYGHVTIWNYDYMAIWNYGYITIWNYGYITIWPYEIMVI